jgi:hypothetical protein
MQAIQLLIDLHIMDIAEGYNNVTKPLTSMQTP